MTRSITKHLDFLGGTPSAKLPAPKVRLEQLVDGKWEFVKVTRARHAADVIAAHPDRYRIGRG